MLSLATSLMAVEEDMLTTALLGPTDLLLHLVNAMASPSSNLEAAAVTAVLSLMLSFKYHYRQATSQNPCL